MSDKYRVVEAENPLAVHCLTWSYERALKWVSTGTGARHFAGRAFRVQRLCSSTRMYHNIGTPLVAGKPL